MTWLDKFENTETAFDGSKYVKLTGEQDVVIDMVTEPVRRDVKGTDGKTRLYWDLSIMGGMTLSCTNYLFNVIRKELDQLKGIKVDNATVRIKKVSGDKISWVVVLKSYE